MGHDGLVPMPVMMPMPMPTPSPPFSYPPPKGPVSAFALGVPFFCGRLRLWCLALCLLVGKRVPDSWVCRKAFVLLGDCVGWKLLAVQPKLCVAAWLWRFRVLLSSQHSLPSGSRGAQTHLPRQSPDRRAFNQGVELHCGVGRLVACQDSVKEIRGVLWGGNGAEKCGSALPADLQGQGPRPVAQGDGVLHGWKVGAEKSTVL